MIFGLLPLFCAEKRALDAAPAEDARRGRSGKITQPTYSCADELRVVWARSRQTGIVGEGLGVVGERSTETNTLGADT